MAFNWQTFRTRAITAVVFAAIMLVGLFWNEWSFFLLFSVIHFGCWREFIKLVEKIYNTRFHINLHLGLMLVGYGVMLLFCPDSLNISGYSLRENISLPVSLAGFILTIAGIFQTQRIHARAFGAAALGIAYISLSWGLMLDLYGPIDIHVHDTVYVAPANLIPVMIIFTIWINDTMAYIVGSLIGKTPFSKISPKKTWEGTLGGIILALIVMVTLFPLLMIGFTSGRLAIFLVPIAATAAIAGTFGDLLESKLKRMAGVKDSGSLMPGHGGFLDRFDSLLLATPLVWLVVRWLMGVGG